MGHLPAGTGYLQLTSYSRQFSDAFSFTGNPAALTAISQFTAGLYSERRFLLEALSTYAAVAVLPTASGNFGFCGRYAGNAACHEAAGGLAYGRNLGSKLAVGVQFDYLTFAAAGYGAAATLQVGAGALVRLSPQVQAGLQANHPVRSGLGRKNPEALPAVYTAGLGYDASPQVFLSAEVQKVEDQPVCVRAGLHYQFAQKLLARAGVQSATAAYYLGFGVRLPHLRVDVSVSLHPYLGATPGLLLLYPVTE